MADWTNVLDSAQDPDAPVTSEWGYAMRDNPIAIAEGAAGAPKVQGRALSTYVGRLLVNSATPVGFTNLSRHKRLLIMVGGGLTQATGNYQIYARFSNNAGSTWGSSQVMTVSSIVSPNSTNGSITVDINTGDYFMSLVSGSVFNNTTGTLVVPTGTNGIQFSLNGASTGGVVFEVFSMSGVSP